jgi:hypothetical protein
VSSTFAEALDKVGVTVPAHLEADAEIPVDTRPQAQGDLLIIPMADAVLDGVDFQRVPDAGVQVVFGEATGNSHWLHRGFDSPDVTFARASSGQRILLFVVPEGQTAQLIHTDEHGAAGIGPGVYAIHEKREQADEERRVTD